MTTPPAPIVGRTRLIPRLLARAPRWLAVLLGLAAIVLGLLLVTRPLSALSTLAIYLGLSFIVSGVADILEARTSPIRRLRGALGVAFVVVGVAVLVWLGRSLELLAPAIAIVLLVSGAVKIVGVVRGTVDERVATAIFGLSDIGFGLLAVLWPDATLLIVAVLFGIRTLFAGIALIWNVVAGAIRRRRGNADATGAPRRRRLARFTRVVAAIGALLLAVLAGVVSTNLRSGGPLADGFYTSPAEVPEEPGALLRAEPFEEGMPDGVVAWRILYTTTRDEGEPAIASGLVWRSSTAPDGPAPVIAWAHGTTGYAQHCAPTLLDDPLGSGAMPATDEILDEGWIVVATDYTGLGTDGPHPYLVGQGEGRSVLDAVLAARQLDELELAQETVVWGHSQGGHAALWAGVLADEYAPDANVIGVAAMAPAANLPPLVDNLPDVPGGSIFASFVAAAYTEIYDDIDAADYIDPAGRTFMREASGRCLSEGGSLVSVLTALSVAEDRPLFQRSPNDGAFGVRLEQNVPAGPIPAPLLLAQGLDDPLVTADAQELYVRARCEAGYAVDYREYDGKDHLGVVLSDSPLIPELVEWTTARLAGEEPRSSC